MTLQLPHNLSFADLQSPSGLAHIDQLFVDFLHTEAPDLCATLQSRRQTPETPDRQPDAEWILACAPYLETFIASLFHVSNECQQAQSDWQQDQVIFSFKEHYVTKQARPRLRQEKTIPDNFHTLDSWLDTALSQYHTTPPSDRERAIASWGMQILHDDASSADQERLIHWCMSALSTRDGQAAVGHTAMFNYPKHLDYDHLIAVETNALDTLTHTSEEHTPRDGFDLTDPRYPTRKVAKEIDDCVYCHTKQTDFCATGFPLKKNKREDGFRTNPLGGLLLGCPLEEHISEMNYLKKTGALIAPLAVAMIQNPLCAVTGHRICNDCMRSCIYQKHEPVNVPQIESRVLSDVLDLPWGVEIYDLLTKWNPLRHTQWLMAPATDERVLVMGMGPAGFTLAHHLMMEGCTVVGADGLKIEPLPTQWLAEPIEHYDSIKTNLSDRRVTGFGGVLEYGITARWDKNFLTLMHIILMRRPHFQLHGNVRFGGTLTIEDTWTLGFDHLAIAVGAGLPRALNIKNNLAPGVRQANDFLMALHLSGANNKHRCIPLTVQLPAIVVGGGLTAVDAATELQAYYIVQVEKVARIYHALAAQTNASAVRQHFTNADLDTLDEWLAHADALEQERTRAHTQHRAPNLKMLLTEWGGVTIVYRKSMAHSPAYQRNYEELQAALREGISYTEYLEPDMILLDQQGQAAQLRCHKQHQEEPGLWISDTDTTDLPARTILFATGAEPNVAYGFEHKDDLARTRFQYHHYEQDTEQLSPMTTAVHAKSPQIGPFTSYDQDGYRVSFLGDTHPAFRGSVVNAMASAYRTYPDIIKALDHSPRHRDPYSTTQWLDDIADRFTARVLSITEIQKGFISLTIRAPQAARSFQPGQFFKLQTRDVDHAHVANTPLHMEGLALLGIPTDDPDVLRFVVIERGWSSRLVRYIQVGQEVSLMGPTGVRTKVPEQPETILVVGGTQAAIFVSAVGAAWQQAGCRVLYVGCFEEATHTYQDPTLTEVTDHVLWVTDKHKDNSLLIDSPDTAHATGDWVDAVTQLCQHTNSPYALSDIASVYCIGSPEILKRAQDALEKNWSNDMSHNLDIRGAVYGPMQCMLKGVCAQCLQWQIDPETKKRTKAVFACSWQHQPLERIDIDHISERLSQHHTQETLFDLWLTAKLNEKTGSEMLTQL